VPRRGCRRLAYPGDKGKAVVLFESQDAAQAWADSPRPPSDAPVAIDSIEVAEVVAQA
jgi:hypothetical protein